MKWAVLFVILFLVMMFEQGCCRMMSQVEGMLRGQVKTA